MQNVGSFSQLLNRRVHSSSGASSSGRRSSNNVSTGLSQHSAASQAPAPERTRFTDWLAQAECLMDSLLDFPAADMTVHAALARDGIRFNWRQILQHVAKSDAGGWFFAAGGSLPDLVAAEAAPISQQLLVLSVEMPHLNSPLLDKIVKRLRQLFADLSNCSW